MNFDPISMLENIAQNHIYQNVQGRLPTEKEINDTVEHFRKMLNILPEDAQRVIAILQSRLTVTMDTGEAISKKDTYKPWLSGRKADIDFFYWDRYAKYLEFDKKWSRGIVSTIDSVSDRMLDLLGDPTTEGSWQRRGLVLGDVQSGKTANYVALTNKAADAGYRVIILLSGIIENLRRQTQERLDEGFIGRSSKAALQRDQKTIVKGVGNIDSRKFAMAFTTESNDFKINTVRSINMSLNNTSQPVLFVVKKNASSLSNLISWLTTYNMSGTSGTIDLPLLLIDDEADNASVNTRAATDPTKINKLIRSLLILFKRASYVGVTATPFANIFIEPDTTDEMLKDDLFPRDFIYALSPPTNYIGGNAIFGEDGKYGSTLERNEDAEKIFPFGHNNDLPVTQLPDSLIKALNYFILVNAVRDLRGDTAAHRSMLVNVSRLTSIQDKVTGIVTEWFHVVRRDIQNYYKLSESEACRNSAIRGIKSVWDEFEMSQTGFDWKTVQGALHNAASSIEIHAVNQRSSSSNLDYEARKENGWRIVAIGGNSLSRGLTLEGLCVSYFYRNTQMYDTLMQMGRWFGYRPGYEDLFKIWMPQGAIDWYSHITEATNELRAEIRRMNQANLTPADFGLRVRAHPDSLIVTARNKMRSAKTLEMWITLDGQFFETPRLISTQAAIRTNQNAASEFIASLIVTGDAEHEGRHKIWKGVPRCCIIDFLQRYANHPQNMESDPSSLTEFISSSPHLSEWDVVIAGGTGGRVKSVELFEHFAIKRNVEKGSGSTLCVSGTKMRVGTAGMTRFGLIDEQVKEAKEQFFKENPDAKSVSDKGYLIPGRRPILILYYIQPDPELADLPDQNLIAYGVGFPRNSENGMGRLQKYVLNVVEQRNLFTYDEEDDDLIDDN